MHAVLELLSCGAPTRCLWLCEYAYKHMCVYIYIYTCIHAVWEMFLGGARARRLWLFFWQVYMYVCIPILLCMYICICLYGMHAHAYFRLYVCIAEC